MHRYLTRRSGVSLPSYIFIMTFGEILVNFEFKDKYNINDLVKIMEILRSENGCPWDREQSHKSIRQNFIEETYEVIEAIDNEDSELLKEELGDVLLQIVFHSRIEEEKGAFDLSDVADGICKKLIIRHPHVFGNVKADTSEQVLKNWDDIKMKTKSQTKPSEAMESVARSLPALIRAQKICAKAKKAGYAPESYEAAFNDAEVRLRELSAASGEKSENERKIGELFFSAVALASMLDINPEESLYHACDDFIESFKELETDSSK